MLQRIGQTSGADRDAIVKSGEKGINAHQTALAAILSTQLQSTNRQGVPSRLNANTITYEARKDARAAPEVVAALRTLQLATRSADIQAAEEGGTRAFPIFLSARRLTLLTRSPLARPSEVQPPTLLGGLHDLVEWPLRLSLYSRGTFQRRFSCLSMKTSLSSRAFQTLSASGTRLEHGVAS